MPQHAWTQQWVTQGVAKGREQGSRSRDVGDTGHSPARLGCYRLFQALAVLPHPVRHFRFGGLLPLLSPNFARRMITITIIVIRSKSRPILKFAPATSRRPSPHPPQTLTSGPFARLKKSLR